MNAITCLGVEGNEKQHDHMRLSASLRKPLVYFSTASRRIKRPSATESIYTPVVLSLLCNVTLELVPFINS